MSYMPHGTNRATHKTSLTPRARERRATILNAAREVFVRDGYHEAKLTQIAREAHCSVGTLYTYFEDRDDLLAAVLNQVEEEMRGSGGKHLNFHSASAVRRSIAEVNRQYLATFQRNAREMALMDQVAQIDPNFREQRRQRARRFVDRNTRMIEQLQQNGVIPVAEDPEMLAASLSGMVSRLAYSMFVEKYFGEPNQRTLDRVLATANKVWFTALGI